MQTGSPRCVAGSHRGMLAMTRQASASSSGDTLRVLLQKLTRDITDYSRQHNLLRAPNPIKVFFRGGDDQRIREISSELEEVIEDLSNTKDKVVLAELNKYPIMATHAHTRPFRRKWLNATVGIIVPLGLFFYLRMLRFRLRLLRDLRAIRSANEAIVDRIGEMGFSKNQQ